MELDSAGNLYPAEDAGQVQIERVCERRSDAEILLAITDVISRDTLLPVLRNDLAPLLRELTRCTTIHFTLYDSANSRIAPFYLEKDDEREMGGLSLVGNSPVEESPESWAWQHQETLALPDLDREARFPKAVRMLRDLGIRSYRVLPLSTAKRNYGVLGIGWPRAAKEGAGEYGFLDGIARLVALGFETKELRWERQEQQERMQSLVAISRELSSTLHFDQLVPLVFAGMRQITNYDCACLVLLEADGRTLQIRAVDSLQDQFSRLREGERVPVSIAMAGEAIETRSVTFYGAADMAKFSNEVIKQIREMGMHSLCCVPLLVGNRALGALDLCAARENAFSREDGEYLQQVATMIAGAIHNAGAYGAIESGKDRLAQEKRYLENEIREEHPLGEIIGNSPLLKRVLDYAAIVAETDATVLITGETGTGKECVARAIHLMSSRKDRSFIKLNCAAIPTDLLESELFGHEKGAFTGAVSQKIGRLELADQGTLLLDEIGDLPLQLQPKLLRVLQDHEFEHLGGTKTIKVNARILAASNRDLVQAVENKEFRSDLFYRLNVFPLHLPSLRDRREDIPLLIRHFVAECTARMNKKIDFIPDEAVEAMMQWSWPGNIRELENFIERSVILSVDNRLRPPLKELHRDVVQRPVDRERTLDERERDHIVEILRQTGGMLSGANGAAARLGIKRTTLQYKMQKMGLARTDYLD
ncbi:MAG: sigma 54-interacting transcriptional regulator [Terriglobales bacterium]|jgi:formate hydrogenlyase transcriptional activator